MSHARTGRRVAITGVGPISSIGAGAADFLTGLRSGSCGAQPITAFETAGFEHSIGCEVTDFDPAAAVARITPRDYGRSSLFAAAAANMALTDSRLPAESLRAATSLVAIGTTDGESRDLDDLVRQDVAGGREDAPFDPVLARRVPAARLSAAVAAELDLVDTEAVTLTTACAAGNYAIGYGYDAVRLGEVDYALCGGADSVCQKTFAGFYRLGTVAPDLCRPFDSGRRGILTGEGAGVVLLEPWDAAVARGAHIYAEVLGFGLNCDADHPVAPNEDRIAECMRLALADAGVDPHGVDLISAHGTGTMANDRTESRAIRAVFGDRAPRTIPSSR
ncbi:beta-ketoacyl-[acyl-carrier-protein] synthase family protein [Nocardia arizonensis]|uniref:beta-ketoacyl-[acyl-carrier-protein] synthase family protein n=1 Tax=Nocardia arizonensis TaxID=1141647 RepID=UPI000A7D1448|nr:beta-ketoacyl-[acyl-carrier-protein] synthase family protein [Nocardia arizonensis]